MTNSSTEPSNDLPANGEVSDGRSPNGPENGPLESTANSKDTANAVNAVNATSRLNTQNKVDTQEATVAGKDVWTIQRLLVWTTDYLRKSGSDSPRLDAEILLAESMGCARIQLYARFLEVASDEVRTKYRAFVKKRAAQTPVAYLVGRKEFFSLDFDVTPAVLIPRPDTEFLVMGLLDEYRKRWDVQSAQDTSVLLSIENVQNTEIVQHIGDSQDVMSVQNTVVASGQPSDKSVADISQKAVGPRVLDLGTGSGILAICAAKHIATSVVTAVDLSAEALNVARQNAAKHGVADRITFLESDLFAAIPAVERFDFILSNPPYVTRSEWESLASEVRDHEPKLALIAGEDGMSVYRRLLAEAPERLTDGGVCLLETSPMLVATLTVEIDKMENVERIPTIYDLGRNARVTGFRKCG